jgi:phytol kinase
MLMCGGDGLADIFGRKWGSRKILWNSRKSWVGSFGMFLGGWILSILIIWIYSYYGVFSLPFQSFLAPITILAFAGTLVESIPLKDIDNITVTLTAVILGHFLFFIG